MTTEQLWELVTADDPLGPLVRHLMDRVWSEERFAAAQETGGLQQYLTDGEHEASAFERSVYDVYADVYALLEGAHPLKRRLEDEVLGLEQFTLVVFDALSLREVPASLEVFREAKLAADVSFALASVPSETVQFTQQHFGAAGPATIRRTRAAERLAYRHVKQSTWEPDFAPDERRRLIWALYPDTVFGMDHGAIGYAEHMVGPVQAILRSVLAGDPVLPVVVTSDHGYLWQGGAASWPTEGEAAQVLARHFKQGRCTTDASVELVTGTGNRAWVSGQLAAVRGRFAWGGQVPGATRLFKHGGVSLMECVVPWVTVGTADG